MLLNQYYNIGPPAPVNSVFLILLDTLDELDNDSVLLTENNENIAQE
jgi:hypothetical protein